MKNFLRALMRGLRLECPACPEPLFEGLFRMHKTCPRCGYLIERESGYFVGAIYINYAVTVALSLGGYLITQMIWAPSLASQITVWGSVCILVPVIFFRYSRSLWLNMDHFFSLKLSSGAGIGPEGNGHEPRP